MRAKISLITLGVRDLGAALAFYRDGLGFKTHNHKPGDDCIFFALEGAWLALYPRGLLAQDAQVSPEGSGFSGVTLAHNVASKQEVDAVFVLAISSGAISVKKPQDTFWGGYSGYFADPDGHLWEIAWNPFYGSDLRPRRPARTVAVGEAANSRGRRAAAQIVLCEVALKA